MPMYVLQQTLLFFMVNNLVVGKTAWKEHDHWFNMFKSLFLIVYRQVFMQ